MNELKAKIQDEKAEISEMLLNTMKDVTEASSLNVNNDPIVTPAMAELNSYLETMRSSVDESTWHLNLRQATAEDVSADNSTANATNCVDPFLLQSIQNVGEAQQFVSNILTNVSSTLSTVSSNFNSIANNNSNGTSNSVVNSVFSAVSTILQSVVNFTNDQIILVNNRIENDYNTFSQAAYNTSFCRPKNSTTGSETTESSVSTAESTSSVTEASSTSTAADSTASASENVNTMAEEKSSSTESSETTNTTPKHQELSNEVDEPENV